ncbi:MAG: PspC domain-containing protein [Acidothermales bacterium]|nr:PspC domain-containing protein [Acidothermales bacterium]
MTTVQTPPQAARTGVGQPRKLYREADRRVLAGVCRGLATHLGIDPTIIRIAFVVLAVSSLVGVFIYAALWYFVPLAPEEAAAEGEGTRKRGKRDIGQLVALAALALGLVFFVQMIGLGVPGTVFWPIVLVGAGAAFLWQQADDAQRVKWRKAAAVNSRSAVFRVLAGIVLIVGGLLGFLFFRGQLRHVGEGLLFAVVAAAGIMVIAAPFVTKLARDLSAERRERIRQEERAELAAHVHDSVLQTLALIQRNAYDGREVQRLARAQERDLRAWLYKPKKDEATTFEAAIEAQAADVEDQHGVTIDVVVVGDCPLDERLGAQLQAAREAMVNAARHSGAAVISVYVEVEPEQVTVFVRDRGKGFDLDTVSADRMGVRGSIVGRMERNGGKAVIRSAPGDGTEVRLEMAREGSDT